MKKGLSNVFIVTLVTLALWTIALVMVSVAVAEPSEDSYIRTEIRPGGWVVAAGFTGTVTVIDTANDTTYGPVLSGTLGSSGGGLFDVAFTPDGKTALFSNFGDSAVYFVDFSNPVSPTVITSVTLEYFAEDIALTVDGKYALVTDGGFSSKVSSLSVVSPSVVQTMTLGTDKYAQAVDVARDGTVLMVDYFGGAIHTMKIDGSGQLTEGNTYSYSLNIADGRAIAGPPPTPLEDWVPSRPVNIGIAPDGQTVLVCDSHPYTETGVYTHTAVGVYRITAPGVISFTEAITGLPRSVQSVAFSRNGEMAYLSTNGGNSANGENDYLAVLRIDGPGQVSLVNATAADLLRSTSSQLFGVDTVAVANDKAYVGYPTVSGSSISLTVVDLNSYEVYTLPMSGATTGVGYAPPFKSYLPRIVRNW